MNAWQQVCAVFIKVYECLFGQPKPVGDIAELLVDQEAVNPLRIVKNVKYQYHYCPELIWASKLTNGWYTIRLRGPYVNWEVIDLAGDGSVQTTRIRTPDKTTWIALPTVRFLLGRTTGVIYELRVDVKKIIKRGKAYSVGCNEPDWPYYINSVILAHLETLKFSRRRLFVQSCLTSKILKTYGHQVFEELIDESVTAG